MQGDENNFQHDAQKRGGGFYKNCTNFFCARGPGSLIHWLFDNFLRTTISSY